MERKLSEFEKILIINKLANSKDILEEELKRSKDLAMFLEKCIENKNLDVGKAIDKTIELLGDREWIEIALENIKIRAPNPEKYLEWIKDQRDEIFKTLLRNVESHALRKM